MGKILIVEDDANTRHALEVRLRGEGHTVTTARDGLTGMPLAIEQEPDLVLLDISLPAGDGLKIASRMKSHPRLGATPVVIMTGSSQSGLSEDVEASGAVALFRKPLDTVALLRSIESFLARD